MTLLARPMLCLLTVALVACAAPSGAGRSPVGSSNGLWKGTCGNNGDGTYVRTELELTLNALDGGTATFSQVPYADVKCQQPLSTTTVTTTASSQTFIVSPTNALANGIPTVYLTQEPSGVKERDSIQLGAARLVLTKVNDVPSDTAIGAPVIYTR